MTGAWTEEVTDKGLQLPQTLTMLPQMSNGVSDHQRNRRLIRALLPETAARNNRLLMTRTQDWSCPVCSPHLLKLPTQAVLHMILLLLSLVQPLFIPAFYPLRSSCYIIHWSNQELVTRPQKHFSILCENPSLYMPGQRVSQKARMLVTNQVKRVTTPFSFPTGTRAERS